MKIVRFPDKQQWEELCLRPQLNHEQLYDKVRLILDKVRDEGDKAVMEYERMFDHASLSSLLVSEEEKAVALSSIDHNLMDAIILAHDNIRRFHDAQSFTPLHVTTAEGVDCWQRSVPISNVGLYIPGGTAPLFSTVLMLATPAKIAGCPNIVMCTPPNANGRVNSAIIAAAHVAGVDTIVKAGGVQAIGAMAYGTQSVPKVNKIFGPGNQYVMAAKQLVGGECTAIDMPAGPSEVCVIADKTSHPAFVAADLLSQAEHGPDAHVMLITDCEMMMNKVVDEVKRQLDELPRKEIAARALDNSVCILMNSIDEAIALSNTYAPEHLIIATDDADTLAHKVVNAGSVFLGHWACESAGDYASGTNHTLPTHGWAKAYSGVNLDSFCRKITFQHLSEIGVSNIGPAVALMARTEQLEAHARAMDVRMEKLNS